MQVKSQAQGSGYGGDWAVRVKTSLSDAAKKFLAEEEAAGVECSSCLKPKLSLLFYVADAHWQTSSLQLWPQGQQSKLGAVRVARVWVHDSKGHTHRISCGTD